MKRFAVVLAVFLSLSAQALAVNDGQPVYGGATPTPAATPITKDGYRPGLVADPSVLPTPETTPTSNDWISSAALVVMGAIGGILIVGYVAMIRRRSH